MDKLRIKEAIVVEGRDDAAVIRQITDALVIETHGFGISKKTWELMEKAYLEKGLIIFTDPDFAGEKIRKRISERFPKSIHAYMPRKKAAKNGDIGIENADPAEAAKILRKVCASGEEDFTGSSGGNVFTEEDLYITGLSGGSGSRQLRQAVGDMLGIGYGNSGAFLKKLNGFNIKREDFEKAAAAAREQVLK